MKVKIKKGFYPWHHHLVRWLISKLPKTAFHTNFQGITLMQKVKIKIKVKK